MKPKILWGAFNILILLVSVAFIPPVPEGPLPAQITTSPASSFLATISPVQGEIYWRQETEQDWFTIDNDQGLDTGNQVLTKAEGRAKIEYYDGIIVRIGPHTLFTVTEQTQTPELTLISRIRLFMGQIFIKHGEGYYRGKFEVETPSGVAAVKGTMMSVQINPEGQTLVTCLEGVCSLANNSGELTLTAGQGARIDSQDQPPQPAEIEDWQLNDWFENDPETVNTALHQGMITRIPDTCNPATGTNCVSTPFKCNDSDSKICAIEHVATPFINCALAGTCQTDEKTETKPETRLDFNTPQFEPVVNILPEFPEDSPLPDITLPAAPILPDEIIAPTPLDPQDDPPPTNIRLCYCPFLCR